MLSSPNSPEMTTLNQQTEEEPMQLGRTRLSPKERGDTKESMITLKAFVDSGAADNFFGY